MILVVGTTSGINSRRSSDRCTKTRGSKGKENEKERSTIRGRESTVAPLEEGHDILLIMNRDTILLLMLIV